MQDRGRILTGVVVPVDFGTYFMPDDGQLPGVGASIRTKFISKHEEQDRRDVLPI
jgi:hypothetical protein